MQKSLLCVLVLFMSVPPSGAEPFTAEHLVRIDRVGAPAVSPDGRRIAYTVRHADVANDSANNDLWLSNVDGGEPLRLTSNSAGDSAPAWSPDGEYVLFLSSRGGSSQVWKIAVRGGEAEPVTNLPLDVGTFRISPTGRQLVVSVSVFPDCDTLECSAERRKAQEDSKVSAKAYDRLFMRHWDHWLDDSRSQLFAVALDDDLEAAGEPVRVSLINADVPSRIWGGSEEYSIAPDGRTIYFAARIRDENEMLSTNFDIYAAPMTGGDPENLTAGNPASDTVPVVSPDGRYLAYLAMSRPGFESDRYRVMLRDLRNGRTRVLAEDWDRSASGLAFTPDGRSLITSAQDIGNKTLWQIDVGSGEPVKLVDTGSVAAFDVSRDVIVYGLNNLASPTELYVLDSDSGRSRKITAFGDRTLANVTMGEYEQFSFEGAGGDTVYGYVVKPADFERGRRYPVAFLIHGGPQGSFSNNFHYRWNPQTYAGQGFAAVMIDFHGSTGYGQAFTDSISGDWGGKPLEDLKLGVAAAVEQYDFLDGDRICALGASYGGFMVNWIAGQWPDRFRCLVNHDGLFDNRAMYYETEELWFVEWENGGPYYEKPENHEKFNPVSYVDRWQTPMLVVHGELDYRVPVTQGIATFTALQRRGIESRFLYFPDENHWVVKPNNSIRWHQEVNAWLHRFLDD